MYINIDMSDYKIAGNQQTYLDNRENKRLSKADHSKKERLKNEMHIKM